MGISVPIPKEVTDRLENTERLLGEIVANITAMTGLLETLVELLSPEDGEGAA